MDQPLVSVILPTYNRANTISRAIDSVLNQTYSSLELIIIDDGSTDNTSDIMNKYLKKDPRVSYIKQEHLGANYARNHGIKLAKGRYIAFQDSDDEWFNDKLEKLLNVPQLFNETYAGVFSAFYRYDQNSNKQLIPKDRIERLSWEEQFKLLLVNNFIGTPSLMLKKETVTDVGGFNNNIPRFQDWEFCLRIGLKYKLYYYPEPLFISYYSPNSISSDSEAGVKALELILSNFYEILNKDRKILSHHYYRLGSSYFVLGYKIKARDNFLKTIQNKPLYIKAWVKLIWTLFIKDEEPVYRRIT